VVSTLEEGLGLPLFLLWCLIFPCLVDLDVGVPEGPAAQTMPEIAVTNKKTEVIAITFFISLLLIK